MRLKLIKCKEVRRLWSIFDEKYARNNRTNHVVASNSLYSEKRRQIIKKKKITRAKKLQRNVGCCWMSRGCDVTMNVREIFDDFHLLTPFFTCFFITFSEWISNKNKKYMTNFLWNLINKCAWHFHVNFSWMSSLPTPSFNKASVYITKVHCQVIMSTRFRQTNIGFQSKIMMKITDPHFCIREEKIYECKREEKF